MGIVQQGSGETAHRKQKRVPMAQLQDGKLVWVGRMGRRRRGRQSLGLIFL